MRKDMDNNKKYGNFWLPNIKSFSKKNEMRGLACHATGQQQSKVHLAANGI